MKTTKKLLAILLTVFLLATMLPTVMADDTSYNITINNAPIGHTYEAYQVFTGDSDTDANGNSILKNTAWGAGVDDNAIMSELNGTSNPATYADAKAVAEALTAGTLNVAEFAKIVGKHLSTTVAGTCDSSSSSTITVTGSGYYFIKDKDNSVPAGGTYTSYILTVTSSTSVNVKTSVPEVTKKLKDTNDSVANSTTDWVDSADHDIGDTVNYRLRGTVSSNISDFTTYKYIFTDSISKGLTVDTTSIKVYVENTDSSNNTTGTLIDSSNYTVTYVDDSTTYTDGHKLTITFNNLKNVSGVSGTSAIVVYYDATLNNDAVIGSTGNPNVVYLTFSNNPNVSDGSTTSDTPTDTVIVFTYKMVVKKVDENNKPLTGATFTLYKYDAAKNDYVSLGAGTANSADVDKTDSNNDTGTIFTWKGLDDGIYKLVETPPTGYNQMDDQYFTVTAGHVDGNAPYLNTLSGDKNTGSVITFSPDTTNENALTATIQNKPGNTLPTTGGVGTTMFYVIGSVLVIGAFILLVAKKRANRTN